MRVVETLGRAFEGSLIGMAVVGLDGRWIEVNDALCRMLGRRADELVGRAILEVTHPDDRTDSDDRIRVLGEGGDRIVYRKRYLRPDGSVVHARVLSSIAHGPDGRPEAIFSQLEDVSDRHEAEAVLRAVDEPFARLFDDAPLGMTINSVVPGDEGRVLRVNDAFCRMCARRPTRSSASTRTATCTPTSASRASPTGRGSWAGASRRSRATAATCAWTARRSSGATSRRSCATWRGDRSTSSARSRTSPRAGRPSVASAPRSTPPRSGWR